MIFFSMNHPILYSYRRCPYAMRARIGLFLCGIQAEQREIVFWDKPEPMVSASPKATVPVLILPDGTVVDESRDILFWAVAETHNKQQLATEHCLDDINQWIDCNDNEFKDCLDKYKYADRFPEFSQSEYRHQAMPFLEKIELALAKNEYLVSDAITLADIAIFPFIRQFANVDKNWWQQAPYANLKSWLEKHLQADYFVSVMKNRPVWQAGHHPLWLHEPNITTRDQFVKQATKQQA